MFARIRALIDHLHDVQEVNALSDRDLDDLGMTRDQVLAFLRMPRDINDRVTAMGAIFGLSQVELKRDHGLWVEDRVAFLDEVGHPQAGMILDIGHVRDRDGTNPMTIPGGPTRIISMCRRHLRHVHLHGFKDGVDHYPAFAEGDTLMEGIGGHISRGTLASVCPMGALFIWAARTRKSRSRATE